MSTPVEIAKAIEQFLADAELAQVVEIKRTYDLVTEQENIGTGIRILIVQGGKKSEALDREYQRKTYRIDVAVQAACLATETDKADGLVDLTEQVTDLLLDAEIAGLPCSGIDPKAQWAPPLMAKANVFLSVHTLLYEAT